MMIPFLVNCVTFILLIKSSTTLSTSYEKSCFESIISFGDSIADTGNLLLMDVNKLLLDVNKLPRSAFPPYGRTFFHHPTGRYSDGRLIIDFIVESLGLPLVKPYISGQNGNLSSGEFEKGVNFAVAGARALDARFFEDRGISNSVTNVSLGDQLYWFKQYLDTIPDSRKFLQTSLVLLGEIGGNDYNDPLQQGRSIEEIKPFVPKVINTIGIAIKELINLGAQTILVPGNFPIGCLPMYLTEYRTTNVREYDSKTGCLNWLNEFSKYHNQLLRRELSRIQKIYPHINIIYADYYNAAMRLYLSPNEFGFSGRILKACCGGGGPYNYNKSALCGIPSVNCCDNPYSFASWDGIHFTEASYNLIAQGLLEGPYTIPHLSTICKPTSHPRGIDDY